MSRNYVQFPAAELERIEPGRNAFRRLRDTIIANIRAQRVRSIERDE